MGGISRTSRMVLSALAMAALLATPAGAAFPGANGSIAFTTYYLDGNENVYAIEPDGTGLRRLTADMGQDDDAAWSPNGRRIAFSSNRAHPEQGCEGLSPRCDYDIYVMNADGTNVTRLTTDPASERDPAWSPDGRRIVFSSTRDSTGTVFGEDYTAELYTMNADGTGQTRLTQGGGVNHQARWSPDGSSIVFRRAGCEFNCISFIFSVPSGGGVLTKLTSDVNGRDRTPDWAPGGDSIVFTRDFGGNHFFTMNPDGTDVTMIPGQHVDPAWSPDGLKIAFGYPGIGHMNVDGSGARPINTSGGEKPDWQPLVPGPRRSDYKNGPAFCRAERDFLGEQDFNAQYGSFGKCVAAKS